jgi:hypothetical protein
MGEHWLRTRYRCGIVLSEQSCASGETPDVIGWKGKNRSVMSECKISRADPPTGKSSTAKTHRRAWDANVSTLRPPE